MTARHDPLVTLPWMDEGTQHFLTAVAALSDDELAVPSRLPGWSRAHVIGHVARNAEALVRLAGWARTGVECPMYESREQRDAEIESTALLAPSELRDLVAETASTLDRALGQLDDRTWHAEVRSALGRTIPAAEIPWMRIREVWLHATDIGGNLDPSDLPDGVVDLLLDDTVGAVSARDGCPSLVLAPVDRERTWVLGPEAAAAEVIELNAAESAWWMSGRFSDADRPRGLPELPRWI